MIPLQAFFSSPLSNNKEYNLLLKASETEDKNAKAEVKKDVEQQVAEATKNVPKITTKGKFKVESQDGDWAFQPIGRIFWDNVSTDDDGSSAEEIELLKYKINEPEWYDE